MMQEIDFSRVPVRVGEVHTLKVVGIGEAGDGVARVKGYAIFIKHKGLQERDVVKAKIVKTFQKFAFAEIVKVEEIGGEVIGEQA